MPTSESSWSYNGSWWQRNKSVFKFRLIVISIIMFVVLPWLIGVLILLSLFINAIF